MGRAPEQRTRRGFTFIEILAAMLFMAIVIPVAMEGLMLANAVGERAARKRVAAELAAQVLNDAVATQSWRDGDSSGDFGDDWPGYTWKVTSEGWSQDTMQRVVAEVAYTVQNREYTETLSTLANQLTSDSSSGGLTQ